MDHQPEAPGPDSRPAASERERAAPSEPPPAFHFLQSCLVAGCASVLAPTLLVVGFFVFLYMLVSAGISDSSKSIDSLVPISGAANVKTKLVRKGDSGAGTIAIVSVHGVIDGGGSPLEGSGALAFVSEQLRLAREDDKVKAVILQIDSPGGGLGASDLLHHEVVRLRDTKKTVIAWAGDTMASGGYYVAVGAEGIMASPTATVGSIGVILQHFQFRELLDKIGVKPDPIVTGKFKDIGSAVREMTPEERELLQDYLDAAHRRFVDIVAQGRGMDAKDVAEVADGRIFNAETAVGLGLVDRVGYIEDALAWAEEKAGEKNMRVISYGRVLSFGDLFQEAGKGAAAAAVEAAARGEPSPRPMAIWAEK